MSVWRQGGYDRIKVGSRLFELAAASRKASQDNAMVLSSRR
jgi:hypothetical protein